MKFRKNILSVSISVAMLSIVGCGVSSQDQGLGSSKAQLKGIAVDGYVAGGVVFVDTNENFKLDQWEPRAITDSRGYFTYSPEIKDPTGTVIKEAISYCDLDKNNLLYQHCLVYPSGYDEVMVRITKGYDLSTNEPFEGFLSMNVSSAADIEKMNVVSPITGLLAEMTAVEKAAFLVRENVPNLEGVDFLDLSSGNALASDEAQRARILGLALTTQYINNIASGFVAGELSQASAKGKNKGTGGEDANNPRAAADPAVENSAVITRQSITKAFLTLSTSNPNTSLSDLLKDSTAVKGFLSNAQAEMKVIANLRGVDVATISDSSVDGAATNIVDITEVTQNAVAASATALATAKANDDAALAAWRAAVADSSTTSAKFNELHAALRATGLELSRVQSSANKTADLAKKLVDKGASAAVMANLKALSQEVAFLDNIASPKTDVADLAGTINDKAGSASATDADASSRKCFTELLSDSDNNTGIKATAEGAAVNTAGFAGNTLEFFDRDGVTVKNSVEIIFSGDSAEVTTGPIEIKATFSEGDFAKKDANGDLEAQIFKGNWSQLNQCSLLVTVEVAGAKKAVTVKPKTFLVDSVVKQGYSFDLEGESKVWLP